MADTEEEESWPFPRYRSTLPRSGKMAAEARREQRLAGHVQRHIERGTSPPRRDRGLSREEIVQAAISVADAEGVEAISMRRIARELKAGVMSLYWYVGSKEELLDLMIEAVNAEIEVPDPTGDWQQDLKVAAFRSRASMLRHPWAMEIIGGRPPSSVTDTRNLERLLAVLDGLGLDPATTMQVLMTLVTYIMGVVVREGQERRGEREQRQMEADLTDEEKDAMHQQFHDWFKATKKYPHIARVVESDIDPDDPETRDERFEFGLNCLLLGMSALVAAHQSKRAT